MKRSDVYKMPRWVMVGDVRVEMSYPSILRQTPMMAFIQELSERRAKEEALQAAGNNHRIERKGTMTHIEVAFAAQKSGDHKAAIQAFDAALEAKEAPFPEIAHFYKGHSYTALGDTDNAVQSYGKAIEIYLGSDYKGCAEHRDACYFTADLSARAMTGQYSKGNYSKAISQAETVLSYAEDYNAIKGQNGPFPENLVKDARLIKGASLYMKGRYGEALDTYAQAASEHANDAAYVERLQVEQQKVVHDWHELKIKPLLEAGKEAEARKEYQAISRRVPGDERAKTGLGEPVTVVTRVDSRENLQTLEGLNLGARRK